MMDGELVKLRRLPPERLGQITLGKGVHLTRSQGVCAMETVAWLAGEKHGMHPGCASYAVTRFVSQLNDELPPEHRDSALKHLLARIPGTGPAGCRNAEEYEEHEELRCLMAEDWVTRTAVPEVMESARMGGEARTLRALPQVRPGMAEDETWQVINAVLAIMREQEREQRESGERPRTHPEQDGLPGRSGVNAARECNYMFRHSGQLHLCAWDALFRAKRGERVEEELALGLREGAAQLLERIMDAPHPA